MKSLLTVLAFSVFLSGCNYDFHSTDKVSKIQNTYTVTYVQHGGELTEESSTNHCSLSFIAHAVGPFIMQSAGGDGESLYEYNPAMRQSGSCKVLKKYKPKKHKVLSLACETVEDEKPPLSYADAVELKSCIKNPYIIAWY